MSMKANVTANQARIFADFIANNQPLDRVELQQIRVALLELADRKDKDEFGTCADCSRRDRCLEFKRLRECNMTASFCADKGVCR